MFYLMLCRDPTSVNDTMFGAPCLAAYGGPVDPNVALGGYGKYHEVTSLWYAHMCYHVHDISHYYGML